MAYVKYKTKDYAEGQLLAGIGSGAVSCVLKAWEGDKFPTLSASQYFIGTLEKRTWTTVTSKERVLVSARSTDTLTFTRSFGGDTAIAFSANDYFCLHANSDIIIDIQDEVTRLESAKLNSAWWLRTALSNRLTYYTNWSGAETGLAIGANGTYLKSNGASSAPSRSAPPFDINWQTVISPVSADSMPFYDTSGAVNWKTILASLFKLLWFFGNGSDGDVSISGTVTLSRDMYYKNLTIPAGQILNPNWYRVFVQETMSGTGKLQRNGNAWSGTTAGAVQNQWSLNMEVVGWNGATASYNYGWIVWTSWTDANPAMTTTNGVWGGASGGYSGGAWSAGGTSGGTSTRGSNYNKIMAGLLCMIHGATQQNLTAFLESYKSQASAGGGSAGGGSGTFGGNGGGAGWNGWTMRFAVYNWNMTGTVEGIGGAGAPWANAGAPYGWGGGWWGGWNGSVVFRIYAIMTADATFTLTGGAGGALWTWYAPWWNGSAGTAGNTGTQVSINLSTFIA